MTLGKLLLSLIIVIDTGANDFLPNFFFFLKNGNYISKTLFYMLEVFIRCFSGYSYYIKLLNEVVIVFFQSGAVFFTFFRL